jgi:hypothetical protein
MSTVDSITIVYASGCYGHWIDWCIRYFGLGEELLQPFDWNGNSHRMLHTQCQGIQQYKEYCRSTPDGARIVGLHPVIDQQYNLLQVLTEVNVTSDRTVFLTPDRDSLMLAWNNKWTKVRPDWLLPYQNTIQENIKQWGVASWDSADVWAKREFLSFWWWPARLSEHGWLDVYKKNPVWDSYPEHKNLNMHTVTLSQLRDDCATSVVSILDYLGLKLQHPYEELVNVCNTWKNLQQHINKDWLVNKIIDSVVNKHYVDWSEYNLTLVDEATIQMILRDTHKLEIKCYNLNTFPTNSTNLRELTFNV